MNAVKTTDEARDTWETLRDLQEKTEAELRKEIGKAAPGVQRFVGVSIEAGTKEFDATMKTIADHTEEEQIELLKAYRRFLSGQLRFVDFRLSELDKRTKSEQPEVSQGEIGRAAQRAFWFPSDMRV
jgi:hypothetical protein